MQHPSIRKSRHYFADSGGRSVVIVRLQTKTTEFSFLLFVSYKKALFSSYIDSHTIATRQSQDLYLPQANLTVYQKGVYYAGIKMFNKFPTEIKGTYNNFKRFKVLLWRFLVTNSFYTVDEYLNR
jgi:hypothetical protein